MRRSGFQAILLISISALTSAAPLWAQGMNHSMHSGMVMPPLPRPAIPPQRSPTALNQGVNQPRAAHEQHDLRHTGQPMTLAPAPTEPHAGHEQPVAPPPPSGTDLLPGRASAPVPVADHLADAIWGGPVMASSRKRDLRKEHGGMTFRQILFNIAEVQVLGGRNGYRWDANAWIGGDINRLMIKSEGEGRSSGKLEGGEIQTLYSRAVDPYWNLQVGIRQDFGPGPSHTYAAVSLEGLAPYWFDVDGTLFLSDQGDVLARTETWYDQRVTQFIVLQPRIEANLAAQRIASSGLGSGITDIDVGLRIRYEKTREFAPYFGVSWERKLGGTARTARVNRENRGGISLVAGVRTWF